MAKSPKQFEPERLYEVALAKPVKRKGRTLSPMHRHTMKGKILMDLPPEAVANVKPL